MRRGPASTRVSRLNEQELSAGVAGDLSQSWHNDYRDTPWVFVGGLHAKLTEGDVLCVLSQFGELEDLHLVRDPDSGASKGIAFAKFSDWRSTVLCVDNLDGAPLLGLTLKCDHRRYERSQKKGKKDKMNAAELEVEFKPGHAYSDPSKIQVKAGYSLESGQNLFARPSENSSTTQQGSGNNSDDGNSDSNSSSAGSSGGNESQTHRKRHSSKHKIEKQSRKRKHKKKKKKEKKQKESKGKRKYHHQEETSANGGEAERAREGISEKRRRLAALSNVPIASWNGV